MYHFDESSVAHLLAGAGYDAVVIAVDTLRGPAHNEQLIHGRERCRALIIMDDDEFDAYISVYRANTPIQPGPLRCEIRLNGWISLYAISVDERGEPSLTRIHVQSEHTG